MDFKSTPPQVTNAGANTKADVTIKVSDNDLVSLAEGKLNPMQAFMQGKIKVSGQIGLAQKLDAVFKAGKQVRSFNFLKPRSCETHEDFYYKSYLVSSRIFLA